MAKGEYGEQTDVAESETTQYVVNSESQTLYSYADVVDKYPDKTVLVIACIGSNGYNDITDAVNEYLVELGKDYVVYFRLIDMNVIYSDYCSYSGSVDYYSGLWALIESGEQVDIISTDKYYYCIRDDLLVSLDDYLENTEVGQTLYSMMPDNLWKSLRYNGTVYGINCNSSINYQKCFYINVDLADKYGYDLNKDLTEQLDLLEIINADESVSAIVSGSTFYTSYYLDSQVLTRGVYWDDEEKTAKSWLDNNDFITFLKTMFKLNQEGLVSSRSDSSFFAYEIPVYLPPVEGDTFALPYGNDPVTYEREYVSVYASYDESISLIRNDYALGISKTSEYQDMAFDFIATMLTDEELNNRMCYAYWEDNILESDKMNKDLYFYAKAQFANLLLCIPTEYETLYIGETYLNSLESAYISEDFDFVFDDSSVYQQCIDVGAVTIQYGDNMYGYSDMTFEEYLSEYRTTLEEAGIEDIIAEANRQYAEWKESQS
ncbi:MAG: ABC transporter substrate-binding protein [Oscillospiraceae bacterium]|nr:ABC transporter substrate-binding protein [Oscillospiraceae bacterium]